MATIFLKFHWLKQRFTLVTFRKRESFFFSFFYKKVVGGTCQVPFLLSLSLTSQSWPLAPLCVSAILSPVLGSDASGHQL